MVSFSCLYSKLIDENMILLLMVINVMTYLKFKLIEEEQIDNLNKKRAFDFLCESLEICGFVFVSYSDNVVVYKGYDMDENDEYLLGVASFVTKNSELEDILLRSEALFYVNGVYINKVNLVVHYFLSILEPISMDE